MKKESPAKKLNLVVNSLLTRLTEFEIQTQDRDFFLLLEDLRDEIIEAKERILENK